MTIYKEIEYKAYCDVEDNLKDMGDKVWRQVKNQVNDKVMDQISRQIPSIFLIYRQVELVLRDIE